MTTFFAMVYILMVNANMFSNPFGDGSNPLGVSYGAIYIATAISAVIGTVLAGLMANLPLVQANGMGLNAFFVYTVCIGFGLTYANALVLVFIEGLFFVVLTATGLRKKIFEALPEAVKVAIPAGIGLFIALLGLQNAGIVAPDESTCVDLASFNLLTQKWGDIMPMVVTLCTFLTLSVMPFTYNISYGIAFGLISFIVISVFCGDFKKIKLGSWIIIFLFIAMLLLTH